MQSTWLVFSSFLKPPYTYLQTGPLVALRSLTSFSTKKLDDILADITDDGDNIEKLVPIIQERVEKGERKDAAEERQKASIARDVQLDWVMELRDEKKQRDRERKCKKPDL